MFYNDNKDYYYYYYYYYITVFRGKKRFSNRFTYALLIRQYLNNLTYLVATCFAQSRPKHALCILISHDIIASINVQQDKILLTDVSILEIQEKMFCFVFNYKTTLHCITFRKKLSTLFKVCKTGKRRMGSSLCWIANQSMAIPPSQLKSPSRTTRGHSR